MDDHISMDRVVWRGETPPTPAFLITCTIGGYEDAGQGCGYLYL